MDLRSVVTELSMNDMKAREIYADMNNTLGADCLGYSTVPKYLREKVSRSRCLTRVSTRKLKRKISSMKQFLALLRNAPFPHSAGLPKEYSFQRTRFDIIWSILWGIESGPFDGFPLALIEPQKSMCRDESRSSSSSPVSQAPCLEKHCYTGRSPVLFSNNFDRIWLPHDELPPSFPKQTIASQKFMITVVRNPHGIHMIQSLPKGIKWTGRYYSDSITSRIAVLRDVGSHRKMIIHADNVGPHVAKCATEYMDHNSLKRVL
jgi:hypothetical protein